MLKKIQNLLLFLLTSVPIVCFAHGSAKLHYDDFTGIFNGYGDDAFKELSYTISSGIDHDLPEAFRQQLGKIPGNHRILGHGWTLNDSIPQETLNLLAKNYPGKEKEIIELWRTFVKRINGEAVRLTGLPPKQANALASLLYDIHLLGDLEPDNTLIKLVLPEDQIIRNIEKNTEILFKNKPEYISFLKKRLIKVLKRGGKNQQAVAESLMTELYSTRMGDMLYATWGNTLKTKYSIDRAVLANARRAERIARPIAKIPGMKRIPKEAADFAKIPGVKFTRGLLQEHKINGKTVRTLSIPISPAKASISAGVMTLVFTEGITVYKFSRGSISEEEFIKESAKNCGGAIVAGTATYVLVALGATPTGWIVIGTGITTELVYEVAFEWIYKEFARPTISMKDILGYLPTEIQQRTSVFDESGFESFLEIHQKRISSLEFTNQAESPFEYSTQSNSPLDNFTKKKSPFEIGID